MIELRAVSKTFPGAAPRRVIDGLSMDVAESEYVAIVGASGIGKSTLLNLIAGLERPDAGAIVVDGVDLSACSDDALTALRCRRMGFVFQSFHVLPYLSVAANVALPLALQGRRGSAVDTPVASMLERVGLSGRGASAPAELSGGELQRVAIARALVHRPAVVLADEPTGNLDPSSARDVIELLREAVKTAGAAGIIVTHSRAVATSADRALRLTADGLREACADDTD
jgi:putative ABC transport system ATP-binding protein